MAISKTITLEIIPNEVSDLEHACFLDQTLFNTWKLHSYEQLYLKYGQTKIACTCSPLHNEPKILKLQGSIADQLQLPLYPEKLQISFSPAHHTIELGPVIGLLTRTTNNQEEPFGHLTSFCEELATYSAHVGSGFFAFSLEDAKNPEDLRGYSFINGEWIKHKVPIPSVIHNRLNTRTMESSPGWLQLKGHCDLHNIPYFNDHFLDKWEVHQAVVDSNEIAPYLPETLLYENVKQIDWMLEKHSYIFIKPIHGSQGKKIYRIKKVSEGFELDFTSFNGSQKTQFTTFHSLSETLMKRIVKEHFIIQQGLNLMTFENRALDFRLLCNRNYQGIWKVASAVARVSGKEQFVSNIARGGEIFSLDEVLKAYFDYRKAKELKRFIYELALETVEVITEKIDGIFGELGVDLAVNEQGHPWLIEVNTKPSKNLGQEHLRSTIRPSVKGIIEYASYLANLPVRL